MLTDKRCPEPETDEEREKTLLTLAQRTSISKRTKQMKKCCQESETDEEHMLLSKCAKQMKKCCQESETDEECEKASQTLA